MKDLVGEVIARILLAIFGVFVLMFSFIVLAIKTAAHDARQKARSSALSQKAREVGLDFAHQRDAALAKKYQFLDHFGKTGGGSRYSCVNVITGTFDNYPVTLFDYYYVSDENKVWWWAPSWETHCYISFFIVNMDSNYPELTIAKEGFFSKIAQAVGFHDIDFESHEFSRRYKVKSKSKKFAYDFCNAQMMDYMLDQPITTIEVESHALALAFDDQHEVRKFDSRLRHVAKLRSLMPDYLFDDTSDETEREARQLSVPVAATGTSVENHLNAPDSSESGVESDRGEQNYSQSDSTSYWWIAYYRGYLLFAALSGLVLLRYGWSLSAVANSALFGFAFYSLGRPSEVWTQSFHMAINFAALTFLLLGVVGFYIPYVGLLYRLVVPNFHFVLPNFAWAVQLVTILLSFVWLLSWVRTPRID